VAVAMSLLRWIIVAFFIVTAAAAVVSMSIVSLMSMFIIMFAGNGTEEFL
jgi:hypothetical protein